MKKEKKKKIEDGTQLDGEETTANKKIVHQKCMKSEPLKNCVVPRPCNNCLNKLSSWS